MRRLQPRLKHLAGELEAIAASDPVDLAEAALVIAKLEDPSLVPDASLAALRTLGERAADRLARVHDAPIRTRIGELNALIYAEERFAGNRTHYDDFRNSLLNVVLERRLGIPISLGLVYMDVARRAGLEVFGVAFPGHFLLRVPADAGDDDRDPIILDPFNDGREMDERGFRALLTKHVGDDATFKRALLRPCTSRQLLTRLLNNLKRTYVDMRSFPHAWLVSDMLLTLDPTLLAERRDRGLLAYHLDDFPAALSDLEDYLRLQNWTGDDRRERDRIWEHVKTLRRRAAMLN